MGGRFQDVDWYCDQCDEHLNVQSGFDDNKYTWKCTECGFKSSISRDNIRLETPQVDDDEYWYKCKECDGGGTVEIPDEPPVDAECPDCEGSGVIQGEAGDEQYGWVRVPS